MAKHFKFKAILPTEEELSRLGQIITILTSTLISKC